MTVHYRLIEDMSPEAARVAVAWCSGPYAVGACGTPARRDASLPRLASAPRDEISARRPHPSTRCPEAKSLLGRFFGAAADGGLPAPVREWLEVPRIPLVAEDDRGARLSIRLIERRGEPGRRVLLLDRWGAGPTPPELAGLGLTPRQSEVLAWAARGLGDIAIGARMGISPRTVNKHLEHVYRRLGARGRTEAVALALSRRSRGATPDRS